MSETPVTARSIAPLIAEHQEMALMMCGAAESIRTRLVSMGWNPQTAEHIAAAWFAKHLL